MPTALSSPRCARRDEAQRQAHARTPPSLPEQPPPAAYPRCGNAHPLSTHRHAPMQALISHGQVSITVTQQRALSLRSFAPSRSVLRCSLRCAARACVAPRGPRPRRTPQTTRRLSASRPSRALGAQHSRPMAGPPRTRRGCALRQRRYGYAMAGAALRQVKRSPGYGHPFGVWQRRPHRPLVVDSTPPHSDHPLFPQRTPPAFAHGLTPVKPWLRHPPGCGALTGVSPPGYGGAVLSEEQATATATTKAGCSRTRPRRPSPTKINAIGQPNPSGSLCISKILTSRSEKHRSSR